MLNFQECFDILYAKANYQLKQFGTIAIANPSCRSHNFNFIINQELDPNSTNRENLKDALETVSKIKFPFLFIQNHSAEFNEKDLLSEFGFSYLGRSTNLSIEHNSFNHGNNSMQYELHRVENDALLDIWCEIIDESFSMGKGDTKQVFDATQPYLLSDDSLHHLYVLYDNTQTPVSASLLYLPNDKTSDAGHYAWGTHSDYRNKGAMSHLVRSMVSIAKNQGFKKSVVQCFDTSMPLAKRVGFKAQGEIDIFSNVATK